MDGSCHSGIVLLFDLIAGDDRFRRPRRRSQEPETNNARRVNDGTFSSTNEGLNVVTWSLWGSKGRD
jgi:hypothetical protein